MTNVKKTKRNKNLIGSLLADSPEKKEEEVLPVKKSDEDVVEIVHAVSDDWLEDTKPRLRSLLTGQNKAKLALTTIQISVEHSDKLRSLAAYSKGRLTKIDIVDNLLDEFFEKYKDDLNQIQERQATKF